MEQALFISNAEHLHYYKEDFSRIYFGNEFCEKLIPSRRQVRDVLHFADRRNVPFTFVTPYTPNSALERLEGIMGFVAQERPGAEVVFNDWGVLQFLQETGSTLTPVMGRLLNKTKRGPRIMNIIDKVPGPTQDYYRGSNIDVPLYLNFLKKNGVARIEFDNALQGIQIGDPPADIHISVYMPFAFVSTTRFCLTAGCDAAEESMRAAIGPCRRECRHYTFNLDNAVMGTTLFRRGNTIFYLNEKIPALITGRFADRVVIEPEIPM